MSKNIIIYIFIALAIILLGFVVFRLLKRNMIEASPLTTTTTSKFAQDDASTNKPDIPKIDKYDVPILMYHYIRVAEEGDTLGYNLSVTPDDFERHLRMLEDNDYVTIKMSDLADPDKSAISQAIYDKKKPIILTFDDGYADAYTSAFPLLQKYDFIGTFYIIRNYVGRSEYMNQNQIDELAKAGMEIGSHSLTHPNLASLDDESQEKQISESKQGATTFCYPAGKYNDATIRIIEERGYTTAVTTNFGIANQDSNLLELRRVRVENGDSEVLKNKIDAAYAQTK